VNRRGPEGRIQDKVVKYARADGWKAIKLSTFGPWGTNGEPDYEFARHPAVMFLIEFKAPGKESTPLQRNRQDEWLRAGFRVYECDDVERGKQIIDKETEMWRSQCQLIPRHTSRGLSTPSKRSSKLR
jgi:hypothetical protein